MTGWRKFTADELESGWNNFRQLCAQDNRARPFRPTPRIVHISEQTQRMLRPITLAEFLALKIDPRELILDPWLPAKGLAMIYASRGIGKTMFALSVAYAIAAGAELVGMKANEPRRVLYIDGEMPAESMQKRLAAIVNATPEQPPENRHFRFLSSDHMTRGLPDLGSYAGQTQFDEAIEDAEIIFIDNISVLVRSGKENEAEGWSIVQEWALRQRREGRTLVFLHHAGKGGAQRGTSRREDVLDTVIALKRPADYLATEGARFEVHFEKARGIFGAAADSFELTYAERDGRAEWSRRSVQDAELSRVADLLREGASYRDAAAELGLTKSRVERLKKKAIERGLLDA